MGTPLVLSGPPGVGKTTVGRLVAEALGTEFIDVDGRIEEAIGMTPGAFIRAQGEAAFRCLEAETLEHLRGTNAVVALGGGTLTTKEGRAAARRLGLVVHLDISPPTLVERLTTSNGDRPLLEGTSVASAVDSMLAQRRETYRTADRVVSAEGPKEETARRVSELAETTSVRIVQVGDAVSRVVIGKGLEQAAAGAVAHLAPKRPLIVIVDRGVPEPIRTLYIRALLAVETQPAHVIELPGGEPVKTWSSLGEILEQSLARGAGRQSVVVGLGGGAVCDIAAMAAHLLGRGAPLILVPTTLLAQADAALGGKCAANMPVGRNLIGAFHAAEDIIVDAAFLESLPPAETTSGTAEVLKAGLIADASLFRRLAAARAVDLTCLQRAIAIKADIVERDPFEHGERKLLNLGHTLGHALEAATDYAMRHGEAVAVGMSAIARLSRARGWLSDPEAEEILATISTFGLPTSAEPRLLDAARPFLMADKKATGSEVDLIVLEGVGRARILRLSWDEVAEDLVRFGGCR